MKNRVYNNVFIFVEKIQFYWNSEFREKWKIVTFKKVK